ncbi:MAG: restriction endonuclease [Gammaproteobacteria bacterium]|nr:restriction endonuclease [Gammaproteobacteria bacterium]
MADGKQDFGHVIPVDPDSVRTFVYDACNGALLVSALFGRANHRPAVSFCYSAKHLQAARDLLEQAGSLESRPRRELWEAAVADAYRAAAESLARDVRAWNGQMFEDAVRQCFVEQGYEEQDYRRYDGEGGDMDMVVSPPPSRHGMFLPTEIAVQVKWKQGVDAEDAWAVEQIDRWARWQESSATKYVISSARGFTERARKEAAEQAWCSSAVCRRCASCSACLIAIGRSGTRNAVSRGAAERIVDRGGATRRLDGVGDGDRRAGRRPTVRWTSCM